MSNLLHQMIQPHRVRKTQRAPQKLSRGLREVTTPPDEQKGTVNIYSLISAGNSTSIEIWCTSRPSIALLYNVGT